VSDAFKTALIRGVIGAVIFAGSAGFSQLATGASFRAAGIAAGVAFFGYLILRSGVEGYIDTQAAKAPSPPSAMA
jgi:hypothetical protein